jgi:glyceraldehyde 3-phosphate dehydrogenase
MRTIERFRRSGVSIEPERPIREAAAIMDLQPRALVSSDIIGSSASCVFDTGLTMASGRLVKIFGWYDNQWGYANRLGQLAALVGKP